MLDFETEQGWGDLANGTLPDPRALSLYLGGCHVGDALDFSVWEPIDGSSPIFRHDYDAGDFEP